MSNDTIQNTSLISGEIPELFIAIVLTVIAEIAAPIIYLIVQ